MCGQSLEGPPAAVIVALARVQAVLGARARTVAAQRPPAVASYVAIGRRRRHLTMDKDQQFSTEVNYCWREVESMLGYPQAHCIPFLL